MMSPEAIQAESRRAARRSAKEGRGPLVIEADDLLLDDAKLFLHLRSAPFIGDRTPRGFKLVDMRTMTRAVGVKASHYRTLFADTSGLGLTYEPALTGSELMAAIRAIGPGYAYAVEDIGQFQVNIRVMRPRKLGVL